MPRRNYILLFGLSFVLVFAILFTSTNLLAQGDEESMRRLWLQGVDFYEQARFKEAYNRFNECLSMKPSSKQALEMRQLAGFAFFVQALSATDKEYGMDIAFVVKKVLQLAEEQVKIDFAEETKVMDLLEKLKSPDIVKQTMAKEMIASTIGQYVVPYCVKVLGDRQNDEVRVEIIVLLNRLGADAVMPVIQILESPDSFTRQNAATILGTIRDERAIPALKKLTEDQREDALVKGEAKIALQKIKGEDASMLDSARVSYYNLAQQYYYDDLSVIYSNYKDWVYWYWSGNTLHHRIVERFEYNEILAEDACYDGLAIASLNNYEDLWTLLTCVYFAQFNEVQSALDVANELAEKGLFPTEKKDVLENRRKTLETAFVINYATGKRRLYKALTRSLKDKNVLVAASCINAIRDLEADGALLPEPPRPKRPGEEAAEEQIETKLGIALVNALIYPEKRVRYAAAECLVSMNPKQTFLHSNKVIPNLIDALGEWKPRVILVIEPDEIIRNRTRGYLTELGYFPITEPNGIKGLGRARQFPTEDLIIISTELPDLKAYEIIDALRHDPRTKHTPVIVTCPEDKLQNIESLYSDKANDVMEEKTDRLAMSSKVSDIFENMTAQPDVHVRARRIAQKAAETLTVVDLANRNFRPTDALDSLITSVSSQRHDDVRNPALQAIGHLGVHAERALPTLVNIFNNRQNTPKIRINAANAIADILRPDEKFSEAVYKACKEALHEDNINVRKAAAKALGAMRMTSMQHWPVATEQRIHKSTPPSGEEEESYEEESSEEEESYEEEEYEE